MELDLSRRRVLAACGGLVGSAIGGSELFDGIATGETGNNKSSGWPMDQYDPGGTGFAPDASPPKDGVGVRWKQRIETQGIGTIGSPIVANGLVYGIGGELLCMDAENGEIEFRIDQHFGTTPAITEATAYQSPTLVFGPVGLDTRGGISIGDHRIGLTRWQTSGVGQTGYSMLFGANNPNPVSSNGTAFVAGGGGVRAIDGSSGRIRWQRSHWGKRPAIRDGTVYVVSYGEGISGYDTQTGEQTFSIEPPGATSVTATADSLITSTSDGFHSFGYDGTLNWNYMPDDGSEADAKIAVANEVAYIAMNHQLIAIDTKEGTELWQRDINLNNYEGITSLAVADGVVYVPAEGKGVIAVDGTDGHIRWEFKPTEEPRLWSAVALAGETVYVIGNNHLYALEEQ